MKTELNRKLPDGKTILIHAASHGRYDMVRWLIDIGASPAFKDSRNLTALDHASNYGHEDVKYLLQIAQLPTWDIMSNNEKSVICLQQELGGGKSLREILDAEKYLYLRDILVDNDSYPNATWFRIHKRFLVGYDKENRLCWLINGRLHKSLW